MNYDVANALIERLTAIETSLNQILATMLNTAAASQATVDAPPESPRRKYSVVPDEWKGISHEAMLKALRFLHVVIPKGERRKDLLIKQLAAHNITPRRVKQIIGWLEEEQKEQEADFEHIQ